MTCPRCHRDNPDSNRFCGFCAAPLSSNSPASLIPTQALAPARPISSATSDSSQDGRFLPGTLLGDRYRIVSLLGAGGMGEVYRASDLRLGQPVALKFLPAETASDPKTLARFHNEVRIARQVAHPNVCRVYDIGEVEGVPYISMEYVDGEDLHSLLRRIGRLPSDKALEIARKLCAGLAAAHDKGVLHRDLKPANIMIDGRGHVLITDFGLAGLMGQIEGMEARNGTPGYMAPEQLSGKEVSAQSDIYALGVVLYEMFTGRRPFASATECTAPPPAPRTIVKDIDPAVENAILRCLATDPRERPQSALSVSAALPGGDPLAAALAAGETPSPEMVAASGQKIGLKPRVAATWLTAAIAALAAFALIHQRCTLIGKIPFDNPPEVLNKKAQEIVQKLGYNARPASSAYGFEYRFGSLTYLLHQDYDRAIALLAKGRPAVVAFWYRSSPQKLSPQTMQDIPLVTQSDPPENVPGMLHLMLEPQGRMTAFTAVPEQTEGAPPASWPQPDWNALFAAAGLDPARFTPVEPQWVPPVMADVRAAWTGVYPDAPEIPIRVEAAAFHGKPVSFVHLLNVPNASQGGTRSTGDLLYLVLQLVVMIACVPVARYNLRLGRGDTRGALRLGLFAVSVGFATWIVGGTHVAGPAEGELFLMAAMRAVFTGALLAFIYISFEPFVRRKWPQTIVSWSRVLVGGFRDPLVGRDVLCGVAMGLALALTQSAGALLHQWLRIPGVRALTDPLTLLGGRHFAGAMLFLVSDVLYKSLGTLFLLFATRTLLRRQWLAAGAVVLILAAIYAVNEPSALIGWPVNIVFFGLAVFTLMRFGLLALAVAYFMTIFVGQFPLTLDFSVWYSGESVFTMAVVLALAAYGFRVGTVTSVPISPPA